MSWKPNTCYIQDNPPNPIADVSVKEAVLRLRPEMARGQRSRDPQGTKGSRGRRRELQCGREGRGKNARG